MRKAGPRKKSVKWRKVPVFFQKMCKGGTFLQKKAEGSHFKQINNFGFLLGSRKTVFLLKLAGAFRFTNTNIESCYETFHRLNL